jgi:iron complex transport system permease protein
MIFQALFRNPLAEPTMLGVASGASFGAAFCIYMGWNVSLFGFPGMAAGAFAGALGCVLALQCAAGLRPDREGAALLLAGVAFNFFFSSLVMILQYMGSYNDAFRLLRWTLGGIQVIGLGEALRLAPVFVLAAAVSFAFARELDLMLCGPEIAIARGMELLRARRILFLAVSFCVALSVAFCGPIAFVGLMTPHLCRLIVGAPHKNLALASIFFGGGFLVLCDTASRTLWSPMELPVGIITSFLGAPFFLWILLRK